MGRHLGTLSMAAIGIVAGLFGSLVGQTVLHRDPEVPSRPKTVGSPSDWVERARAVHRERSQLPQLRLSETASAAEESGAAAQGLEEEREVDEASEAAEREAEMRELVRDPAKARAATLKRWSDALSYHDFEALDQTWSGPTSQAFTADLQSLSAAHGFRFLAAQCKTTTCSARLEWPDYQSALRGSMELLHHSYRTNCGTATTLPPPPSGTEAQPYQMTMLYDCVSVRGDG